MPSPYETREQLTGLVNSVEFLRSSSLSFPVTPSLSFSLALANNYLLHPRSLDFSLLGRSRARETSWFDSFYVSHLLFPEKRTTLLWNQSVETRGDQRKRKTTCEVSLMRLGSLDSKGKGLSTWCQIIMSRTDVFLKY